MDMSVASPPTLSRQGPVRVLYLRGHIAWTGGTIYFLDTLPRIDPARLVVRFCVMSDPAPEAAEFEARGITPEFLHLRPRGPGKLRQILREIAEFQPDILHLSGPRAMLYGRLAGLYSGLPAVLLFNNALPEPWHQRWVQARLPRPRTFGMAVSQAMATWGAETYRIPRHRIEVIHGGRELDAFLAVDRSGGTAQADRMRESLGIPPGAKVLILAGRVVDAQKGQFGMIRAMTKLRARIPDAHLLVVGDGADLEQCRSFAETLGLTGAVTFTGLRRDMPDLLAAADLAVVPSLVEEAFGFAALEASASGIPVVAFDAGGLSEAVPDGEAGTLVPKGDWGALVEAIAAYLSNPDFARAHGAAGRLFARGFSPERHAEKLMQFHETLVATGPSAARREHAE